SGDEKIGPRKRLELCKVLECRRIALDLVEISEFKRHIHGVGIEAQPIMADASRGDESLGLRQRLTLGFRYLERSCEHAENVCTVVRPPELLAQVYSLLQQVDRLGTVSFGKGEAPEKDQADLLETPRPQAADKLPSSPDMLVALISLPEIKGGDGRYQHGVQLGPFMTDTCRSVHGDQRLHV